MAKTGRPRIYQLNESYFDKIDNQNKAYLLGYIFADGHVSSKHLIVSSIDISILENIKHELEYTGPIYTVPSRANRYSSKEIYRLHITSKVICSSIGLLGKRPGTFSMPHIETSMIKHFIRGYFDGDGSISLSDKKCNINGKQYIYKNSPSFNIIVHENNLDYFLGSFLDFGIPLSVSDSKTPSMKYIRNSSIKGCLKIKQFLYQDANFFLARKKDKFDKIAPVSREGYSKS